MPDSSALPLPESDPTSIFELFRGAHATELLVAAATHFRIFDRLAAGPVSWNALREQLQLQQRPMCVLTSALRAMKTLQMDGEAKGDEATFSLTPVAREHLTSGSEFQVSDYLGLAADAPNVQSMIQLLCSNRPMGADEQEGAAFIFRDGVESAMEQEQSARHFTLALAGRAKNVAPHLARRLNVEGVAKILDIGGGTGIYSIALLRQHPTLRAVVLDRPEVLKIADEMSREYGVADRVQLEVGDMFVDPLPRGCQLHLLSNILHDWDEPECESLLANSAAALPPQGRLAIHDVFLDDDLGGPLAIALYSASLFSFTEGRAYSVAEYRRWLSRAGLTPWGDVQPTLVHCGVLQAVDSKGGE